VDPSAPTTPVTQVLTVADLGERRLLARIVARLDGVGRPSAREVIGIGDDAAVVAPARNALTVLTTDASVEGVHFDRTLSTAADIGFRALAVNLSDLAAMGASPRWALLSLAMPEALGVDEVDGLVDGVAELAGAEGVRVIGGNLTRSPGPLMVDITAVGETQPRRILTRRGGRPGDELYVTGRIGAAAAGLAMLRQGEAARPPIRGADVCVARYRRPAPRVRLGVAIAQARAAQAAIDLSDGLADALRQIADASGCGVEIDADAVPIEPAARAWWEAQGIDPVTAAMTGGDDYELLVAVPRRWRGRLRHATSRVARPALQRIGILTRDPATRVLVRSGRREPLPQGFEHFRAGWSR
jgi:thiamine-monophosphate kinase